MRTGGTGALCSPVDLPPRWPESSLNLGELGDALEQLRFNSLRRVATHSPALRFGAVRLGLGWSNSATVPAQSLLQS